MILAVAANVLSSFPFGSQAPAASIVLFLALWDLALPPPPSSPWGSQPSSLTCSPPSHSSQRHRPPTRSTASSWGYGHCPPSPIRLRSSPNLSLSKHTLKIWIETCEDVAAVFGLGLFNETHTHVPGRFHEQLIIF
jgi:hypothetical protein